MTYEEYNQLYYLAKELGAEERRHFTCSCQLHKFLKPNKHINLVCTDLTRTPYEVYFND